MCFIARILIAAASVACCSLVPGPAAAQQSFKAPIRIIVPYAAGGGADVIARLLAPGLSRELGQNVLVDNKAGASGQIGTQQVFRSPANGTVVLFTPDQPVTSLPFTTPSIGYEAADFIALGQAVRTYWTLGVPAIASYKDFKEYVAALKRDPLLRAYGVPLTGGAMAMIGDAIGKHAGVEMTIVPYNGSAPVMQNVIGGQVPAGITGMPEAMAVNRSGLAKVIAISGDKRSALLPDTPTFKESGVQGLEFHTFLGFFAPKGLPFAMAQEFNAALRKTLADPAVLSRIRDMSLEPAPTTLDEAAREFSQMSRFWKEALGRRH